MEHILNRDMWLTGLGEAGAAVALALAGPAARAAEVEEARVALVTLRAVHARLAHACPRAGRGRTEPKTQVRKPSQRRGVHIGGSSVRKPCFIKKDKRINKGYSEEYS